jgi:NhaA family Na+:H+ antiporter
VALAALIALNLMRVRALSPYLVMGAVLWFFVLKSGVHATIAGVLLATAIPTTGGDSSPLGRLEHALQKWVAYLVLPVFGFANAGVAFGAAGLAVLAQPVTLGSALGLFLGKQAGVFGGAWLTVRAGLAQKPEGASWAQVYGVAILCGIGFTMSLFIGLLAFTDESFHDATKIGVLGGSLLSAVVGYAVLRAQKTASSPSTTR